MFGSSCLTPFTHLSILPSAERSGRSRSDCKERKATGSEAKADGTEPSKWRSFTRVLRPSFMSLSPTSLVSAGGLASRGERYVKGEGTEPEHSVSQGRRTIRLWILELGTRDHIVVTVLSTHPTPPLFPSLPLPSVTNGTGRERRERTVTWRDRREGWRCRKLRGERTLS